MTLRQEPPDLSDPADDPLLPFVVAAKSGDQGAERELLLRLAPVVLEVARGAFGPNDPELGKLSLEALVATLKALPTFRGDESISDAVALIALERAKAAGRALHTPQSSILAAARVRVQRGVRPGDGGRIASLVERALSDDAAVLVSHIAVRTPKAGGRRAYTLAVVTLGLVAVGLAGFWLMRSATDPASDPPARRP